MSILLALALLASPARAEPPIPGLADLHAHPWDEYNFGGAWLWGSCEGKAEGAVRECDGLRTHGAVATNRQRESEGVGLPAIVLGSDDRNRHLRAGISTDPLVPHWAGWPTSDTNAHQQMWSGWMRLSHEGLPFLWYLEHEVLSPGSGTRTPQAAVTARWNTLEDLPEWAGAAGSAERERWVSTHTIQLALRDFHRPDTYAESMKRAWNDGYVGVNVLVASMVNFRDLCALQRSQAYTSPGPGGPAGMDYRVCEDGPIIEGQATRAIAWARENESWVGIARSAGEARAIIAAGKLAMLISFEASDVFDDPARSPTSLLQEAYDRFDLRVVQPVHELDNRFGGAAPVNVVFDTVQRMRLRLGKGTPRIDPNTYGYAAERRERLEAAQQDLFYRPGAMTSRRGGIWAFLSVAGYFLAPRTPGFICDLPDAPPGRCFTGLNSKPGAFNSIGLSDEGRQLLVAAMRLGIPIDLAHMSRKNVLETSAFVPKGYPLYISHSYPYGLELHQHEDQATDEVLGQLAAHGGSFGLINREEGVADRGPALDVASLYADTDCEGTSVTTLAFFEYVHRVAPSLGLTFGTDFNGFINHVRGVGRLRPTVSPEVRDAMPSGGRACASIAPSIGSEVGGRGQAHIGLLPQGLYEMYAWLDAPGAPDNAPQARAALDRVRWGADHWIAQWDRAEKARDELLAGKPVTQSPTAWTQPADTGVPTLHPRDEILITARLPGPGLPEAELPLRLLRAVEAILPYADEAWWGTGLGTGSKPAPESLPQTHPTVGWQFGVASMFLNDPERVARDERNQYVITDTERAVRSVHEAVSNPCSLPWALNLQEEGNIRSAVRSCAPELAACFESVACLRGPPVGSGAVGGSAPPAWKALDGCVAKNFVLPTFTEPESATCP